MLFAKCVAEKSEVMSLGRQSVRALIVVVSPVYWTIKENVSLLLHVPPREFA